MNKTIGIGLLCLLGLGTMCVRQPLELAGGSTNTTNARVKGTIVTENGSPMANARVSLKAITITPSGDSVLSAWQTVADASGAYAFDQIPKGNYVLSGKSPQLCRAAYQTKFEVRTDTTVNLMLSKPYVLKGRVRADSSVSVPDIVITAAGTSRTAHPDRQGFYSIPDLPRGQYDLGFIRDEMIDYMPV
jgi:hypothetical protein